MAEGTSKAASGPGKSRLGRGLSSLIKVSIPEEALNPVPSVPPAAGENGSGSDTSAGMGVGAGAVVGGAVGGGRMVEILGRPAELPVADIKPNPHQPRRSFDPIALRDLTESIKTNGIIQPIVVRAVPGGGYELIAGERRWRASQSAGLTTIPAIIKEVDGLTQAQMALVENIQREDLDPLERAGAYNVLLTQLGLTQAELAVRLGEERSTVANYVRLLDLAEPVKRWMKDGLLSLGHAKLLAGVTDVLEQERLGKLVVAQGLSVRNLEKILLAGGGVAKVVVKQQGGRDAHYAELEQTIGRQLGMRVQLRAGKGKGKGKLTIGYASLEEFDRLMEKLGVDLG